ncbi:MAG: hypothetical protein U0V48_04740 [Anaerolineales bacterium]
MNIIIPRNIRIPLEETWLEEIGDEVGNKDLGVKSINTRMIYPSDNTSVALTQSFTLFVIDNLTRSGKE